MFNISYNLQYEILAPLIWQSENLKLELFCDTINYTSKGNIEEWFRNIIYKSSDTMQQASAGT